MIRRTHVHSWLLPLGASLPLALASCSDTELRNVEMPDNAANILDSQAMEYTPEDGQTVRLHDVIIPGPDALRRLRELEIPIIAGPRTDSQGRSVVAIRSTGRLAESLRAYGMEPSGHHPTFFAGDNIPTRLLASCNSSVARHNWGYWPSYSDDEPNSLSSQILSFEGGISHVIEIGRTAGYQPIYAQIVGPVEQLPNFDPPTIYILGTYHAREWASTAVTMELARRFAGVAASGGAGSDADLWNLLLYSRVIFVPVVNPDGYNETIFGNRDQRKNLSTHCSDPNRWPGVDLNRNHNPTHGEGADSVSSDPCDDAFKGSWPASEEETQAIERLYGLITTSDGDYPSRPVASISYHSYGSFVVYPEGLDENVQDRCLTGNCFNPDFLAYRQLFGDHETPQFFEPLTSPPLPMLASSSQHLLYSTSGDFQPYATMGDHPHHHLAITAELTSENVGFYLECEDEPGRNAQDIVNSIVSNQLTIIKELLGKSFQLASSDANFSYFATRVGRIGLPTIVRDSINTSEPWFVVPVWRGLGIDSNQSVAANGHSLQYMRAGAEYDLWGTSVHNLTEPGCMPCQVTIVADAPDGTATTGVPYECTNPETNCYMPDYPMSGWAFQGEYYYPNGPSLGPERYLNIPPGYLGTTASSQCAFMFSTSGVPDSSYGRLLLDRVTGPDQRTLQAWPYLSSWPNVEMRDIDRFRSESIAANRLLVITGAAGTTATDGYAFRVAAGDWNPGMRVYDPIIFCKFGTSP